MTTFWQAFGIALAGLGLAQSSSCADPSLKPERSRTFRRELPRRPNADEAVHARISVGALRRGDTIVVRTPDGRIAGSIAPFGIRAGQKPGTYSVPIPRAAIAGRTVTLKVEVVSGGVDAAVRAPTAAEVEEVTLEFVDVGPTGRER